MPRADAASRPRSDALGLADHARGADFYVDGLTGLRGVAAFWVYLVHAWAAAGDPEVIWLGIDATPVFSGGWSGVDVLFTLSGFLLYRPFAAAAVAGRSDPPLGRYFTRRLLRVLPAYYAQLMVLIPLAWMGLLGAAPSGGNVVAHVLMVHTWFRDFAYAINGVWWTLPIEFGFYLTLPLAAAAFRSRFWLDVAFATLALTLLYRCFAFEMTHSGGANDVFWGLEQLPGRYDQFVLGMLAARVFAITATAGPAVQRRILAWRTPLLVAGLAICSVLVVGLARVESELWRGHPSIFFFHTGFALGAAMVVLGTAWGSALGRSLFGNRPIVFLGIISYSLYLWHYPLLEVLPRLWFPALGLETSLFWILVVFTPLSVALAWIGYTLTEKPFLARSRTR